VFKAVELICVDLPPSFPIALYADPLRLQHSLADPGQYRQPSIDSTFRSNRARGSLSTDLPEEGHLPCAVLALLARYYSQAEVPLSSTESTSERESPSV
jgi:hypothetical protein